MSQIPEFWQKKYRRELGRNWDLFYKRNETRFFRDRHWIAHEFPELLGREMRVFEVGCGVGNFLFPLLELNPLLSVVGCDISPRAVELFKEHDSYDPVRCCVFVANIITDDLSSHAGVASVDAATCIFVLSALPPESVAAAIRNVWRTLRPGGLWFIRDYAAEDAAQHRFNAPRSQLDRNLFVRQDGTLAHYFDRDELIALLTADGMFALLDCQEVQSKTTNIKDGLSLDRLFLQIKLQKQQ